MGEGKLIEDCEFGSAIFVAEGEGAEIVAVVAHCCCVVVVAVVYVLFVVLLFQDCFWIS